MTYNSAKRNKQQLEENILIKYNKSKQTNLEKYNLQKNGSNFILNKNIISGWEWNGIPQSPNSLSHLGLQPNSKNSTNNYYNYLQTNSNTSRSRINIILWPA